MLRIGNSYMARIQLALKAFTVALLAAATFFAFGAEVVVAFDAPCDKKCTDHFGSCIPCDPPWRPYFASYSRCIEYDKPGGGGRTLCIYACGRESCPPE